MFDLNPRIDFDEVMSSLLVDQEFRGSGIPVVDVLSKLDRVRPDGLANFLGKMCRRGNLDNLLMTTLNGTIAFKQVNNVALRVSQDLNFDVTGTF